jgi:hypothetical protein
MSIARRAPFAYKWREPAEVQEEKELLDSSPSASARSPEPAANPAATNLDTAESELTGCARGCYEFGFVLCGDWLTAVSFPTFRFPGDRW